MHRSDRLPRDLTPNAWARRLAELRASGAALLDLTESNPTRVGLAGAGAAELAALGDPRGARYEPEARGLPGAREAVAAYYEARAGTPARGDGGAGRDRGAPAGASTAVRLSPERVVLTSGTSESYAHLFRLVADPGDTVLVPAPGYPLFEPIAALEGVRIAHYRLAYDGAWHLDLGSVEAALAAAESPVRALVVVEPSHPTGTCLTLGEVAALEELCERGGMAIVSDEVFGDFPWPPATSPLPGLLGERRVPTFVLGGLSKCCGMPQLKLGWIAAAGPPERARALLEGLEWIADAFLSVATPVQLALPRLLAARGGYQARVRERLATNLASLATFAAERGDVDVLRAQGGWTAILRLPARIAGEQRALDLLGRGVVVHPGHFYDLEGEAHLVLSLITEPETFTRGLERLAGE